MEEHFISFILHPVIPILIQLCVMWLLSSNSNSVLKGCQLLNSGFCTGLYSFPPDSTLKIFARQQKNSTHTVTVHTDSEYCCIIGSNWHFDICVHEMPGQWVARRAMLMLVHLLFQVSAWASRCICVTVCVCSCSICHFEAAVGKMSLRSALDKIKQPFLRDYVCVNTKPL